MILYSPIEKIVSDENNNILCILKNNGLEFHRCYHIDLESDCII